MMLSLIAPASAGLVLADGVPTPVSKLADIEASMPVPSPLGSAGDYSTQPKPSGSAAPIVQPTASVQPPVTMKPSSTPLPCASFGPSSSVKPSSSSKPVWTPGFGGVSYPPRDDSPYEAYTPDYIESDDPYTVLRPMGTYQPGGPGDEFIIQKSVVFNESCQSELIFSGYPVGIESIGFNNKELRPGIDYVYNNLYLVFTKQFMDTMKLGKNELFFAINGIFRLYTIVDVYKVNQPVADRYTSIYPLSDTSDFYDTFHLYSEDTEHLIYPMAYGKEIDHSFLYFDKAVFENVGTGTHYIEVVIDGKAQILTFSDKINGYSTFAEYIENTDIKKADYRPEIEVDVATEASNMIKLDYTIRIKNDNYVNLEDIEVRYYYGEAAKNQQFACDSAYLTMPRAPYYIDIKDNVKGTFNHYVNSINVRFGKHRMMPDETLHFSVRINKEDWTKYDVTNAGKIEVLYNGEGYIYESEK